MLYSEFLEGSGAPDNAVSHTIYSGLNRIYMRHDEYTKDEAYRDGAKIVEELKEVCGPVYIGPKHYFFHGVGRPFTYSCFRCGLDVDEEDLYCKHCGAEFIRK